MNNNKSKHFNRYRTKDGKKGFPLPIFGLSLGLSKKYIVILLKGIHWFLIDVKAFSRPSPCNYNR